MTKTAWVVKNCKFAQVIKPDFDLKNYLDKHKKECKGCGIPLGDDSKLGRCKKCQEWDTCPECGELTIAKCRCRMGDRMCRNRHHWAICKVHGKVGCRLPAGGSHPLPNCPCYS